jgi:glutathione S-transferase
MPIKLHRCPLTFLHSGMDHCYPVQQALDDLGIEYEVVKEPLLPRSRRKDVERLSGQRLLPVIEFEDGTVYREESADMAATIRTGQLDSKRAMPRT